MILPSAEVIFLFMQKILYYAAQAVLLLSSLLVPFVSGNELLILCISCLVSGLLLMLVYAFKSPSHWGSFFLYATVVFCHAMYLSLGSSLMIYMLVAMILMMVCAAAVLVWLIRGAFPYRRVLEDSLFGKAALIPEVILNYLLARQSGDSTFSNFSWVLLALTSAYVIAAAAVMYRKKIITPSWAFATSLLEFFFFTDLIGDVILLIMAIRHKEKVEEVKKKAPLYAKSAFNKSGSGKMKSAEASASSNRSNRKKH